MAIEAWLRGPIEGVEPLLMPVAHSLVQVREEVERRLPELEAIDLWARPGAAAPPGFHLMHLAGSLDRLFTYARGEALSAAQKAALVAERPPEAGHGPDPETARRLVRDLSRQIDVCLDQVRQTPVDALTTPRAVGRANLPSSVIGLLFHAAEHATRHAGQLATTLKALKED
jgi:hypothetical protein